MPGARGRGSTSGLPGYSEVEGEAFRAAAILFHPRHQLPFVLSRVAASEAICSVLRRDTSASQTRQDTPRVVFTESREMAPTRHGCRLSISHEDPVAASVAWPISRFESSNLSCAHVRPKVLGTEAALGDSPSTSPGSPHGVFAYAVDVASVADIHRVRSRFPQLGRRWMPQCATAMSAEDERRGLARLLGSPSEMIEVGAPKERDIQESLCSRKGAGLRGEWWRHLPTPCVSEADAYAAVVLAQHWAARECAVKLVGITGRSFAYEFVGAPTYRHCEAWVAESVPFTVSLMAPKILYCAEASGAEASALAQQGLGPLLYFYTWIEWVPLSSTVDLPYVVMLACAPYSKTTR